MNRPYTICHMMMSADGRIDCGMTVKINGAGEYYETLSALEAPSGLSGRVTAQLEMAGPGVFVPQNGEWLGEEAFSKKCDADGYEIIADSKGCLNWTDNGEGERPLIVMTSVRVSKEYLASLDARNISWIACGQERVDLNRAVEILYAEFGVKRMAVVGGGTINGAFLDAGLLDEVSILLGSGIDGRDGMTAVFDGSPMDREPVPLKLMHVQAYPNGAAWLRYSLH